MGWRHATCQRCDPSAVEMLKLWSQVILDTEERKQQVLWFV
jgi:hypothetical protein